MCAIFFIMTYVNHSENITEYKLHQADFYINNTQSLSAFCAEIPVNSASTPFILILKSMSLREISDMLLIDMVSAWKL